LKFADRASDPIELSTGPSVPPSNARSLASSAGKKTAPFWDRGLSEALSVREVCDLEDFSLTTPHFDTLQSAHLVYRIRTLEGEMERERVRTRSILRDTKSCDRNPSPSPPRTTDHSHDQFAMLTVEKVLSGDGLASNDRADVYSRQVQSTNRAHFNKQRSTLHDGIATARYKEALRRGYVERLRENGVEVPALCPCGRSLYDSNIEMCANNCTFYKNRKAYEKAALSMIVSMQT
jgi:hypothetical protein